MEYRVVISNHAVSDSAAVADCHESFLLQYRNPEEDGVKNWRTLVSVPRFNHMPTDGEIILEFMRWMQTPGKILKGPQEINFFAGSH